MKQYLLPEQLQDFILFCTAKGHTQRTLDQYSYELHLWVRWLDERNHTPFVNLQSITHRTINTYLADKRPWKVPMNQAEYKPLSPETIQGRYLTLSSLYSWATIEYDLPTNPINKVPAPKVPKKIKRRIKYSEYLQLDQSIKLNNWIDLRDRLAIRTFFLTGIRLTALTQLTGLNYDIQNKELRIKNKGGHDHIIPLVQEVIDAYIDYSLFRPAYHTPHLFLSDDGNHNVRGVLTPGGMRQRIKTRCEMAGIPYRSPHAFRHGLGRFLLNTKHAPPPLIQKILGHSKLETTMSIYAEYEEETIGTIYRQMMEGDPPNKPTK